MFTVCNIFAVCFLSVFSHIFCMSAVCAQHFLFACSVFVTICLYVCSMCNMFAFCGQCVYHVCGLFFSVSGTCLLCIYSIQAVCVCVCCVSIVCVTCLLYVSGLQCVTCMCKTYLQYVCSVCMFPVCV